MAALSGTTKDSSGAAISRLVRVYRRDTGAYVGRCVSDPSTGIWSIATADTAEHFAIAHAGTPQSIDQNWDKVVFACRFNGSNGATTFVDEKGGSISANGDAQISTAQSMFGVSSLLLDGAGDYCSVTDSAGLRLGTGDLSIRLRFRMAAYPASGGYYALCSKYLSANSRWAIYLGNNAAGDSGIKFLVGNGTTVLNVGTPDQTATLSALGISVSTWHEVEVNRSGGALKLYLNGVEQAKTQSGNTYDLSYATAQVQIGALNSGTFFNGNIEDMEIYKGVANHTSGFTPSSFPFLDDVGVVGGSENAIIYDRLVPV